MIIHNRLDKELIVSSTRRSINQENPIKTSTQKNLIRYITIA